MEKLLVSVPEAAAALGLGRSKFYLLMASGEIKTINIGTRRLVRTSDLRAFVDAA